MIKVLISLLGIFSVTSIVRAELTLPSAVDFSARYFTQFWRGDPYLGTMQSPQIIRFPSGSDRAIWGGCVSREQFANPRPGMVPYVEHFSSNYCSLTHTISVTTDKLKDLYYQFGDAAVFYLFAHEFAHAYQAVHGITTEKLPAPRHELQADCLAGMFAKHGQKYIGLDEKDVLEMAWAAFSGGDPRGMVSHGSHDQRQYSFLLGYGHYEGTCEPKYIEEIVQRKQNRVNLSKTTFSFGSSPVKYNYSADPKTFRDFSGELKPKSKEFSEKPTFLRNFLRMKKKAFK